MTTRDLILLLERLGTLHKAELRSAAARHDLRLVQLETLHYLDRCNRYSDTPSAITEYLGLTKGTVSQTVRALVKKALVVKQPDPNDARKVHCMLSPSGRAIVDDTQPPRRLADAVQQLGDPRSETLRDCLELVLQHLQRSRGDRTFGSCTGCRHLEDTADGPRCGVTQDRLRSHELAMVCRLHEPFDA